MTQRSTPISVHQSKRFLTCRGQGQVWGMTLGGTGSHRNPVLTTRDVKYPPKRSGWRRITRERLAVELQSADGQLARRPAPWAWLRRMALGVSVQRVEKLEGFVHRHGRCSLRTASVTNSRA